MERKKIDELLQYYREITPSMTQEKYDYLKANGHLSPAKLIQLAKLRRSGANDELLARAEYSYLFESYANSYYKWWKENEWGKKEDESLSSFADGMLTQEVSEKKGATR